MVIKVLFFAGCQDAVGKKETEIDVDKGATVKVLLEKILEDYPALEPLRENLMLAVNSEYVSPDTVLQDGDEFAFIPPVSGGRDV